MQPRQAAKVLAMYSAYSGTATGRITSKVPAYGVAPRVAVLDHSRACQMFQCVDFGRRVPGTVPSGSSAYTHAGPPTAPRIPAAR